MHKKGRRDPGIVTCKFSAELDMHEAESFIKTWIGYCVTYVNDKIKFRYNFSDRHIVQSAALEGAMDAFTTLKTKFSEESYRTGLILKVLRKSLTTCFYHQLIYFGYIPDKKRRHFAKEWISWEDFFTNKSSQNLSPFMKLDLYFLMKTNFFSELERKVISLFMEGDDAKEISKKTGSSVRWIHKILERVSERIKVLNRE